MSAQLPEATKTKKTLTGVVVSDCQTKTIVVKVVRRFMHKKYNKFIHKTKKFYAHDENQTAKLGQMVVIIESSPISKLKRWRLKEVK